MGTDEIMAWIMDTYRVNRGHAIPGVVTGKPVRSAVARAASGDGPRRLSRPGGLQSARHVAQWPSAAVQGFGNVGRERPAAAEAGAKVVAVSDSQGGLLARV